jgi:hypothetical protein
MGCGSSLLHQQHNGSATATATTATARSTTIAPISVGGVPIAIPPLKQRSSTPKQTNTTGTKPSSYHATANAPAPAGGSYFILPFPQPAIALTIDNHASHIPSMCVRRQQTCSSILTSLGTLIGGTDTEELEHTSNNHNHHHHHHHHHHGGIGVGDGNVIAMGGNAGSSMGGQQRHAPFDNLHYTFDTNDVR